MPHPQQFRPAPSLFSRRPSFLRRAIAIFACAALPLHLHAQRTEPPIAGPGSSENSEVPQVPGISGLLRGINGGLSISGLHDAATGWATIAQPAIGFSFNDTFAIDVTVPIYMYRLAESNAARPKPDALLVTQRAEPGDVIFGLHAQFLPPHFQYQASFSATVPTGDITFGLSSGRPTFDLDNHFEHNFKRVSPSIDLGVGDSTTLVNRLVNKNYTSLGPLAHFQVGFSFPLPWGASFSSSAYEQLPIGDQKIYRSVTRRGTTRLIVSGHNITEDNGFTSSIEVPIDGHTSLNSYYNRSLRLRDDVVGIGITYVLRGVRSEKQVADDELLRSIEARAASPRHPPAPEPEKEP